MSVKFSQLEEGQLIEHDGEIITKNEALFRFKQGTDKPMYVVTKEFKQSILSQVYNDYVNGLDNEEYTAPNNGKLIIFDETK